MYHVIVREKGKAIADAVLDGLADAVAFGTEESQKGNVISIYSSVLDATGNIVHLQKVISIVAPDNNPMVLT